MKVLRVYHGDDDQTHFEEVDLPLEPSTGASNHRTPPRPASQAMFASQNPGSFLDWHPAPSRRLFVLVAGSAEVGVTDGEKRTITKGDVVLFEDVTGPGHTMRVLGGTPRVALHVRMED